MTKVVSHSGSVKVGKTLAIDGSEINFQGYRVVNGTKLACLSVVCDSHTHYSWADNFSLADSTKIPGTELHMAFRGSSSIIVYHPNIQMANASDGW